MTNRVTSATEICDMNKGKRPERGTPEYQEWLRKEGEEYWDKVKSRDQADFDEEGILFGDAATTTATDAELFPDEVEEYRPEERKPRLVPKKKN